MTDDLAEGWFSDTTATFGDRLAAAREGASLTREEFARRLGVKLKTVAAWEEDLAEPRANKLQMMAGMLNVSVMWLLTGRGDGVEPPDAVEGTPDAAGLVAEIRQIRAEIGLMGDRLGRLEKRLRAALQETH